MCFISSQLHPAGSSRGFSQELSHGETAIMRSYALLALIGHSLFAFSGNVYVCFRGNSVQREGRMSYAEFVWFLISEEDKKNPTR